MLEQVTVVADTLVLLSEPKHARMSFSLGSLSPVVAPVVDTGIMVTTAGAGVLVEPASGDEGLSPDQQGGDPERTTTPHANATTCPWRQH